MEATVRRLWRDYNLSIVLFGLFIAAWIGQTVVGWAGFVSEQQQHGQAAQVFGSDGYVWHWAEATLENWQSEFLQLFSFTIMAAVFIHKGSAESKDSGDRILAAIKRIEENLGTEPVTQGNGSKKDLHVIPDEAEGWQLRRADSTEPEGYYDTQAEAIEAGRQLARSRSAKLLIHDPEGDVRDSVSHD